VEGKWYELDEHPTLFWDEIEIIPPPRPKSKVKKVVEGWVNFYTSASPSACPSAPFCSQTIHRSEEEADLVSSSGRLEGAHFIRHEYEVEE
jgi:hypothetical protein